MDKALEEIKKHRDQWYALAVVDACLILCREKGFSLK